MGRTRAGLGRRRARRVSLFHQRRQGARPRRRASADRTAVTADRANNAVGGFRTRFSHERSRCGVFDRATKSEYATMAISLNHTIVAAHDKEKTATFLTEMLGLPPPMPLAAR